MKTAYLFLLFCLLSFTQPSLAGRGEKTLNCKRGQLKIICDCRYGDYAEPAKVAFVYICTFSRDFDEWVKDGKMKCHKENKEHHPSLEKDDFAPNCGDVTR